MEKISIISPSFNNAKYLSKAIESCINQTYRNIEIVIVEGGSTDNSLDIISGYADKEPRLKVLIHTDNKGVSKARNDGIVASSGEFIAILDSDDLMTPTRLEELYVEICKDSAYGLVHSDVTVINSVGMALGQITGRKRYSKGNICGEVLRRRGCHIGYPMIRRSCLEKSGLYDEILRGGEDYDLYTRLTRYYPVAYVQRPLYLYRRHGSNASSKLSLMVVHYKQYLDNTFNNDTEGVYNDIKNEAYAHYYIDLMNLEFTRNNVNFVFYFFPKCILYCMMNPGYCVPVIRTLGMRLRTIIQKKIARICRREFVQVGW